MKIWRVTVRTETVGLLSFDVAADSAVQAILKVQSRDRTYEVIKVTLKAEANL